MKKFEVTYTQQVARNYKITVEAENKFEAKEKALDDVYNDAVEPSWEKVMDSDTYVEEIKGA